MRNRVSYASVDKYKSVPGLISILMGAGTVLGILILFVVSYVKQGNAGIWIGAVGILFLLVAFVAIVVAIFGLRDPDAQHGRPVIGLFENMVIFVLIILLYISGL